jgi:hypothetical protein
MAAPIRFLSGRQQQQKIGIEGSTDNQKVLEVVGRVGIGTTIFDPTLQLEVRGSASVSDTLTAETLNATTISVTGTGNTFADLTVTGVSTFQGNVRLLDDDQLSFGNDDDTTIVHDENNTTIRHNGTGNLKVVAGIGTTISIEQSSLSPIARFTPGDSVDLYHNGSKKFETTSSGVDVTGKVETDTLNVSVAATTASLTLANAGVAVTAILDEDGLTSDRADALATQQSIKAYVDAQVTAQDLDFAGDIGTGAIDLDSETFTIAGTANEIETAASGNNLTIGLPNVVAITTSLTVGSATTINSSGINAPTGIVTASSFVGAVTGDITGVASTATALETARDFSITGSFVTAPAISFDGRKRLLNYWKLCNSSSNIF